MVAASNIRLPGVYFLPPPTVGGVGLPPLDVAAFVGFAERGPLDTPVAITDLNSYRAIFGGDLEVAREAGGGTIYAALPRAVGNFFENGGRRCYVVRVAGRKASSTRFRVPALVSFTVSPDPEDRATPARPKLASIGASSPGRWSEQLRIGTRLQATPLPFSAFNITADGQLSWSTGSAPEAIQAGDMLRLTFSDDMQWIFPVTSIERLADATPATPVKLSARYCWRVDVGQLSSSPQLVRSVARLTTAEAEPLDVIGTVSFDKDTAELAMAGSDADKISAGDALLLEMSDDSAYLFPITQRSDPRAGGSPQTPRFVARTTGLIHMPPERLPLATSRSLRRVERLRFELLLRQGKQRHPTLLELSFNPGPPRYREEEGRRRAKLSELLSQARPTRFWSEVALLESSPLYRRSAADIDGRQAAQSTRLFRLLQTNERIEEARDGSLDPVALAGLLAPAEDLNSIYLPLGMPAIVSEEDLVGPADDEVGNDDLETFEPNLFVDPFLVPRLDNQPASGDALMKEAFDRYYVQDKRLRGMHSLIFIDEVALITTPESTQPGWELLRAQGPPVTSPPISSPPLTSPPLLPDHSEFQDCNLPLAPEPPAAPLAIATAQTLPIVTAAADYRPEALLEIQHASLNFCQARGDVVCILTLPLHFEKRQCIEWQEQFRQRLGLPASRSAFSDAAREICDLSYAAVFHPWLLQPDPNSPDGLRRVPCDGAVCGMIAARERARQVWVAPANVPLQSVLGLTPVLDTADWADLFDLQFNLLRAEPRDFRLMSAHTLSDEAILLQISVRRLMILLRKVAVDRGMDFVFESNHQRFREAVRLTLEEVLRFMFERGAFAGATPEQSYRVVTDKSVNTPESVDAGRFIAQIQVAPSQPMEFITVLLTRVGDDLLQAREA